MCPHVLMLQKGERDRERKTKKIQARPSDCYFSVLGSGKPLSLALPTAASAGQPFVADPCCTQAQDNLTWVVEAGAGRGVAGYDWVSHTGFLELKSWN